MTFSQRIPFINGLKKLVKKTIFSLVPGVPKKIQEASAHKSVRRKMARSAFLGCGCHPPFEKVTGEILFPNLFTRTPQPALHCPPMTTHHTPLTND